MSQNLLAIANLLRNLIIQSTTTAGSGHPTSSLSSVHLMTSLFFGGYFKTILDKPEYIENDRLIFSKGHAAPLFYAMYTVAGHLPIEELMSLRQFGSSIEGHPTMLFPFTEAATGSLGQGLSIGVGMALQAKMDDLKFRTYVLLGDSEMAEGSIWEAMEMASHYKLNNLVAIVDVNRLGQRGETLHGWGLETYKNKAEAFGWEVLTVDGHNLDEINKAFDQVVESLDVVKPKIILAKTKKGFGVSFAEDKPGFHGKAFNTEQAKTALEEIGPVDVSLRAKVNHPDNLQETLNILKSTPELPIYQKQELISTRKAYGQTLLKIAKADNQVVVLDAEMNNSTFAEYVAKDLPNQYFEMYIAEQNMVGTALGLSRRGKIPFVSTFAAFLSRAYDQIRMLQYSEANIKIMGSHCGVSIGEDGSSQMALEDISWSRSIHGSTVLYPADGTSMSKLTMLAYDTQGIVYIRGTRSDVPTIYNSSEEFEIGGSKTIVSSDQDIVTLVGAGITLFEVLQAGEVLKTKGINARVIDLYSVKPLDIIALSKAKLETQAIFVVEDHYPEGGLYSAVCESLANQDGQAKIYSLAVTKMPRSGKPKELLQYQEIDFENIVQKVMRVLTKN